MTEESVLRELADFALREYHEGRTKPLSEFMEETQEKRRKISRDELLKTLEGAAAMSSYDEERAHIDADMALLDYINDDEIRQAFDRVDRWYA